MGRIMSYAEFERASRDFAAYLQSGCGLRAGDRYAIMLPNLLQFPIALFGALRAGLIVVACNPLYTARELEQQLRDSGATGILALETVAHTIGFSTAPRFERPSLRVNPRPDGERGLHGEIAPREFWPDLIDAVLDALPRGDDDLVLPVVAIGGGELGPDADQARQGGTGEQIARVPEAMV